MDSAKTKAALDSLRQRRFLDSLAQSRLDSIVRFQRGDTIKTPLSRSERPATFEVDTSWHYDRDAILSSGATNLVDLLDRIPGVSSFRTSWLAGVHLASFLGDFARVRVFVDGLEVDANDPRSNGVLDLVDVHLWTLDDLLIERGGNEVRVWCRTWTTTRTTSYTRTDIFTGDLNTNGFRGLFGRRMRNGFALQFAAQQVATQQGSVSAFGGSSASGRGDGNNQTLTARVGWARRQWSADAYGVVINRDRDATRPRDTLPDIPAYKAIRREGYVRVGYGDTSGGFWSQLMMGALRTRLDGIRAANADTSVRGDTTRSRSQRLVALGYATRSMQLSLLDRWRVFEGKSLHSPAVRASYSRQWLSGGVLAERAALDSSRRVDVAVRAAPLNWLAATLSHSQVSFVDEAERDDESATRAEAGLRWRRAWFTAGAMRQSQHVAKAPPLIGSNLPAIVAEGGNAITFGARGPLYKDMHIDVQGIRWTKSAFYRPQFMVRTDLSVQSRWLNRFPKGQFGINYHLTYELRDPVTVLYPFKPDSLRAYVTPRTQLVTTLLEIRIQRAIIFYQFRNLTGGQYEQVPSIIMPRQVQYYGVRWEFWN